MKVLMVNGSSNKNGCTYTALTEVGKELEKQGVEYEIFQLGAGAIRDCIACNRCDGGACVFSDDNVNEFVEKARSSDGFIFGSPVYFAHPSGRVQSFLDRAFYCAGSNHSYEPFAYKPAAAVVSARRGGTTAAIDVLNKYFTIAMMPVVSSTYWNMVHGNTPEEVLQDKEGLQTMRNIGKNMAWMLKCFDIGKQNGIHPVPPDADHATNFIR